MRGFVDGDCEGAHGVRRAWLSSAARRIAVLAPERPREVKEKHGQASQNQSEKLAALKAFLEEEDREEEGGDAFEGRADGA